MKSQLLTIELARAARVRRAMPILWVAVFLCGAAALIKVRRALQVAAMVGLSSQQVFELLWANNSVRMTKTFPGYAMVLVDLAISAAMYIITFCLAVLMLALRAAALRRQVVILRYAEELEKQIPINTIAQPMEAPQS